MSMGYGARCRLIDEDETTVIYEYACSEGRDGNFSQEIRRFDGIIMIEKECFIKAEIHEKIKRRPSGRKVKVIKRIINSVDVGQYISDGKIKVENCKACIQLFTLNNETIIVGRLAYKLLYFLFMEYQKDDTIPHVFGFYC